MLYLSESALQLQDMATLEEKVAAALERAGMTRSSLGEALGYKYGYQAYHAIFVAKTTALTKKRRELAAKILGVEPDYFDEDETAAQMRARATRQEYEAFLQFPDVQKACDAETLETLRRMEFVGGRVPSRELYRALALMMAGYWTRDQIKHALDVNAKFDAMEPLPEPPPPKSKKRKKPKQR